MTKATAPAQSDPCRSRGGIGPWGVIILLGLLCVCSFADRLVLAVLVGPLGRDLGASAPELGFSIGFGFVLVYALAGVPIAQAIDRGPRKAMVVGGVLVWSLSTLATAWVTSFWQLSVLRAFLALGEAVLTPAAVSLIADLFPPNRRTIATSTYMTMSTVGAAAAASIGGFALYWAQHFEGIVGVAAWRLTFILIAMPGLFLGLGFALFVREPMRRDRDSAAKPATAGQTWQFLRERWRLFSGIFLAVGFLLMIGQGLSAWMMRLLEVENRLSTVEASYLIGMVSVPAALAGTFIIPYLSTILGPDRAKGALLALMFSVLLSAPLIVAIRSDEVAIRLAGLCLAIFGQAGAVAVPAVAIQHLVPASMHARTMAICILVMNLLGLGAGPLVIALIADSLSGAGALSNSVSIVAATAVPLAALALALAFFGPKPRHRSEPGKSGERREYWA